MRSGWLNPDSGWRGRRGRAIRDSRSDPGRKFERSSLGPCSRQARLERQEGGQTGRGGEKRGGCADMDIIKEKHEHLHSCAELMTPGVIRVH